GAVAGCNIILATKLMTMIPKLHCDYTSELEEAASSTGNDEIINLVLARIRKDHPRHYYSDTFASLIGSIIAHKTVDNIMIRRISLVADINARYDDHYGEYIVNSAILCGAICINDIKTIDQILTTVKEYNYEEAVK